MTDEWRIRELLKHILESQCTPEEACAECPELLSEVRRRRERMRRVEQQIDALFPSSESVPLSKMAPGPSSKQSSSPAARLPHIDGYEVEGVLGRGGMGIVYRARHLKLNRIVALKMLVAGPYATPQEVARFVRESQAVAELQHSHIVQVHDVGDLDGRPYFTMEFVEGGSLAQELAGAPQPARRAAELVAILAGAVHLAHSKGIIHRDLKPSNILLTAEGTPKIADFGLARHLAGDPRLTMSDARVGTPSYMAPEQALGKLGTVGPSVDIYALGAILYEMLTGRPPFRAETAIETERQVITVEAVPPSHLNANVPRDLETICLKCLHKDPSRRYASAAELAEDIRRFLGGQPVRARPVGWVERGWRWGNRNRTVAAGISGISLLLVLIVVGSLWVAAHFRELEGQAQKLALEKGNLAKQKERLAIEADAEREKAVVAEQREAGLRRQSEAQGKELRRNLYLTEINLAGQAASVPGGLGRVSELLARWKDARPDLRNWEWYFLNSLCHRSLLTRIGHMQGVQSVAWSPGGARLASAGTDRTICIWDVADERPPLRLIGHTREVFSVAWSPDGERLASASWDDSVRVWDTKTGIALFTCRGHTAEVYSVAWSPDGNTIASGGRDSKIQIWDAADGGHRNVLAGHADTVAGLAWSPDSQRLASAAHDAKVLIWDVSTGKTTQTLIGHNNWVNQVAWNPDGSRLASVSNDQTLRIWDPENGQEVLKFLGHTKGVAGLAWSPDGSQLASASDDRTVKVWRVATGTEVFNLRGHTAPLTTVAWSPADNRLASAGHDGAVKVWDAATGPETPVLTGHEHHVEALAWCPGDPTLCASADAGGVVRVWDVARRALRWTGQGDQHFVYALAWHPAGTRVATASGNGLIRIWPVGSPNEPEVLHAHTGDALSVAWSPDGRRLATGGSDNLVRLWDAASGKVLRTIENHQHFVYCVAWSPDGKWLASASGDRTVKIWDAATGAEMFCYRGHTSNVTTVAWSPDGTKLASAGFDQTVHLWDAATGQRTVILRGHTSHVAQVRWSPDGSRLASACRDGRTKIWDTETGTEALTLESHSREMDGVAWSADGMILVTAADDRQLRIYDATAGYVAARAPQLLPAIDRRLAIDASQAGEWRLRAEVFSEKQDWQQAALDLRRYVLLQPDRTWFMLDGAVAGPYPSDLTLHCPPEDFDFSTAQSLDAETINIPPVSRKVVPYSSQGVVDFRPLMDFRDHVSGYALFPVYSLLDQQVAILIGTDDQSRLWLNGECLYESLRSRAALPDDDAVAATLKSGWNALLVRVANETGDHALYLRLSNSETDLARVGGSAK